MTLNPQLEFDFVFRHGRPFLEVEELVEELDCSRDFILGHVDDGEIVACDFKLDKENGIERCLRLFRPSVNHFLIKRKLQSQFHEIAKNFKCDFNSAIPHSRPLLSLRDCWWTMNVTDQHVYNFVSYKRLPVIPISRKNADRKIVRVERSIFIKFLEEARVE